MHLTSQVKRLYSARCSCWFTDEISFVAADRSEAVAISLWDRKENAESYNKDIYPQVLKTLTNVLEGTPKVEAYEVSNSTFHKIASSN